MTRIAISDRTVELDAAELNVTVSALGRMLAHLEHEVADHGLDAVIEVECDPNTVRMLLDRLQGRERHVVEVLPTFGRRSYDRPTRIVGYFARCSCGASSERLTSAGMASGWDARHREEVGAL